MSIEDKNNIKRISLVFNRIKLTIYEFELIKAYVMDAINNIQFYFNRYDDLTINYIDQILMNIEEFINNMVTNGTIDIESRRLIKRVSDIENTHTIKLVINNSKKIKILNVSTIDNIGIFYHNSLNITNNICNYDVKIKNNSLNIKYHNNCTCKRDVDLKNKKNLTNLSIIYNIINDNIKRLHKGIKIILVSISKTFIIKDLDIKKEFITKLIEKNNNKSDTSNLLKNKNDIKMINLSYDKQERKEDNIRQQDLMEHQDQELVKQLDQEEELLDQEDYLLDQQVDQEEELLDQEDDLLYQKEDQEPELLDQDLEEYILDDKIIKLNEISDIIDNITNELSNQKEEENLNNIFEGSNKISDNLHKRDKKPSYFKKNSILDNELYKIRKTHNLNPKYYKTQTDRKKYQYNKSEIKEIYSDTNSVFIKKTYNLDKKKNKNNQKSNDLIQKLKKYKMNMKNLNTRGNSLKEIKANYIKNNYKSNKN